MKVISRHIPQRTCVACRQIKPKRELIRLVRNINEWVEIDPDGKKAGRGAYLCKKPDCWQTGLKNGQLEHRLRMTLTPENREHLMKYGKDLLEESVIDEGK
jgi:predicted RNA-binding protein YlxR (DUF448 family)